MLDVLVRSADLLTPDSDVRGAIDFLPGGSAANFAVWVSRCGADVRLLGAVGDDFISDHLLADLSAEGVDTSGIVQLPGRSASVFALVSPDGERTMVTDRRVTLRYGAEHVTPEMLRGAAHLHLTAYSLFDPLPMSAAFKAAEIARAEGASISLDLSSSALITEHGPDKTCEGIARLAPDVLFGNEGEWRALTGCAPLDPGCAALRGLAPVVVVKLGNRGCALVTRQAVLPVPTQAVRPLDTTGAGDAFDAAWLCARLRGVSPAEACEEGNRLAARVVSMPGARGVGSRRG